MSFTNRLRDYFNSLPKDDPECHARLTETVDYEGVTIDDLAAPTRRTSSSSAKRKEPPSDVKERLNDWLQGITLDAAENYGFNVEPNLFDAMTRVSMLEERNHLNLTHWHLSPAEER